MDKQQDKLVAQLETILAKQLESHEQLRTIITMKHQALRQAKHQLVRDCTMQENRHLQAIAEAEKQRITIVGELTLAFDANAKAPMPLTDIAMRLDEPQRGRLLIQRQQLRGLMEQVRDEAGKARRTAEAVTRHMTGLIQTVTTAMSGSGAYGRQGAPSKPGMQMSTFSATA
jgi:hypothetical protein